MAHSLPYGDLSVFYFEAGPWEKFFFAQDNRAWFPGEGKITVALQFRLAGETG